MRESLLLRNANHPLKVMVVPGVLREGVAVSKDIMLPHPDDLAEDRSLAAALAPDNQRLAVCDRFDIRLVSLKRLLKQIVTIGIGAAEVGNV